MMSADRSKIGNMPQEVKYQQYPDPYDDMSMEMRDDISGIDEQIKADSPKRKAGFKPAKLN